MIERVTAKKTSINALVNGEYVAKEGMTPNYVRTPYGAISRANVIAVIVDKPSTHALILDDGTAKVQARLFDDATLLEGFATGDVVLVIGRPRAYQKERYLAVEILKRLATPQWLELRKAELAKCEERHASTTGAQPTPSPELKTERTTHESVQDEVKKNGKEEGNITRKVVSQEEKVAGGEKERVGEKNVLVEENSQEENDKPEVVVGESTKLLTIIRELDAGNGALVEDVIMKMGSASAEQQLTNLMAEGEIFELKPGRVKVLE